MEHYKMKYSKKYSKHSKFYTFSVTLHNKILELEAEHFAWVAECKAIKRETEAIRRETEVLKGETEVLKEEKRSHCYQCQKDIPY
jgi:hypothetical protein